MKAAARSWSMTACLVSPCDAVYGMHNFPQLPMGYFALRPGPMMAAYDVFDIHIKGVGGHAAMPHLIKDPILTSSYMIGMFQSIISRNVNPVESAVISVTKLNAGTNYNIIPNVVTLQGTTEAFSAPYPGDDRSQDEGSCGRRVRVDGR